MCVSREWGRACRGLGSLYREFHVTLCRELYWLCMYAHQGCCLLKERLFTTNTLDLTFMLLFYTFEFFHLRCCCVWMTDRKILLIWVFFWFWFMALISKASFLKFRFFTLFVFSLWFSWWFSFFFFLLLIILYCSGLSIDELSRKKLDLTAEELTEEKALAYSCLSWMLLFFI